MVPDILGVNCVTEIREGAWDKSVELQMVTNIYVSLVNVLWYLKRLKSNLKVVLCGELNIYVASQNSAKPRNKYMYFLTGNNNEHKMYKTKISLLVLSVKNEMKYNWICYFHIQATIYRFWFYLTDKVKKIQFIFVTVLIIQK